MEKYNIILADPPWAYRDKARSGKRGVEYKYDVLSIDEIKQLPVQDIAANDCALFLWVTFPLLQEGLNTMRAWGFEYKTIAFNWVKQSKRGTKLHWGMGNWTRANSEICLLGIKGKPKRISAGVHSVVIESPVEEHSKKPGIVRERIVQLMGDIPRIELFAREKSAGWAAIGNGINGIDIRDILPIKKKYTPIREPYFSYDHD